MLQAVGEMLALGIATSIHPCPLAAGVAAVAFLARRAGSPRQVLLRGCSMRSAARSPTERWRRSSWPASPAPWRGCCTAGSIKPWARSSSCWACFFGDGFACPGPASASADNFHRGSNAWASGRLPMGVLVALSFCPASAAVFFGGVLRMAVRRDHPLLLPLVYGVGAVLPVLLAPACWPSAPRRSARRWGSSPDRLLGTADRRGGVDPDGGLFLHAGSFGPFLGRFDAGGPLSPGMAFHAGVGNNKGRRSAASNGRRDCEKPVQTQGERTWECSKSSRNSP